MDKFKSILNQNLTESQKKTFTDCVSKLLEVKKGISDLKHKKMLAENKVEETVNMINEATIIIIASAADDCIGEQQLQDTIEHYLR